MPVREELALFALIRHAPDAPRPPRGRERRSRVEGLPRTRLRGEDFLFLLDPEFDGIEETEWAPQHAVVGLKSNEGSNRSTRQATAPRTLHSRPAVTGSARSGPTTSTTLSPFSASLCGVPRGSWRRWP